MDGEPDVAQCRVEAALRDDAAVLGTLMNTRGLMELIVLNIGLDLKVISPTLFAMMVVMALTTTMATSPVLAALTPPAARAVVPDRGSRERPGPAESEATSGTHAGQA